MINANEVKELIAMKTEEETINAMKNAVSWCNSTLDGRLRKYIEKKGHLKYFKCHFADWDYQHYDNQNTMLYPYVRQDSSSYSDGRETMTRDFDHKIHIPTMVEYLRSLGFKVTILNTKHYSYVYGAGQWRFMECHIEVEEDKK